MQKPPQWSSDIATNVEYIDNEHKEIAKLIASLAEAIETKTEINGAQLLRKIHKHVFIHFHHEEALMLKAKFPTHLYMEHVHEHNAFRTTVVSHTLDVMDGILDVQALYDYLVKWFDHHTTVVDQMYVPYTDKLLDK